MSIPSSALIVGILGLTGLLAGCGQADADPRTRPPLVRVAHAGTAGASDREFTGVVGARMQSDLGFRVAGKVVARLVDAGQVVRRGGQLPPPGPARPRPALMNCATAL